MTPVDTAKWRYPSAFIGGACALLGLLVLIGWHLHLPALIQLRPNLAPMQYNTALCILLAGDALAIKAWGKAPLAVLILGGLVAALGSLTFGEYLFHADFGIDQRIFRAYIVTETSEPGRMSPVTSFCLAVAGLAFFFLELGLMGRWRALIVGSLASIIVSISVVALAGYAFGLPGAYGWGHLTRMAAHTAGGVGLLGAAFFMIAWHIERHPGERTPRWLPLPMALGVFTGALVLYFALDKKQDQEILQTVKAGADSVKSQISLRMDGRMRGLARMARRWEMAGAPGQAAWEADAADYVHDVPDAQSLEWIDTDHRIRWVVPLAGNETKLNLDLTREARRKEAMERAERENQPVITGIVTLFRGGLGFIIYVPIVVDGQPHGFLGAVLDSQICLERYLPVSVAAGEAIRIRDRSQTFFERDAGARPDNQNWVVREKIDLHGAAWDLEMWPTPALASRLDSPLPAVVLCAGALGSLLLAALCFYAQRASREAAETARANAALQAALDQVKTLEGLLPICSCCKRVRDDTGYWNQIDTYLHRHTRASLSHGYCPECAIKACEEFGIAVPATVQAQFDEGKFE